MVVISSGYDPGICLETGECQEDIGYVVRRPGWDMNPGHFPIKMVWSLASKNKLLLLDPTQQVPYQSFTWRLKQTQFMTLDNPALQAIVTFPAGPAQIETCANRTWACIWSNTCVCIRDARFKSIYVYNCIYVCAYTCIYVYTRVYKEVQLQPKLQHTGTWSDAALPPRHLCNRPALFFHHFPLIALPPSPRKKIFGVTLGNVYIGLFF